MEGSYKEKGELKIKKQSENSLFFFCFYCVDKHVITIESIINFIFNIKTLLFSLSLSLRIHETIISMTELRNL